MTRTLCILSLVLFSAALAGCSSRSSTTIDERMERQDQQLRQLSNQLGQVEQVRPGQMEMSSQLQTLRQEIAMINTRLNEQGGGETTALREKVNRLESVVRKIASQLAINVDSLDAPVSYGASPSAYGNMQPYTPAPSYASSPSSVPGQTHNPAPLYPSDPVYPIVPGDVQTPDSVGGPGLAVTPDGDLRSGTAATSGAADTATSLYDSGIKAFDDHRYKDAVVTFKDFAATYPKHNLAGNAHFWQGESYYQLKDYPRAALAYQEVISKYPGSPKVQSAMLKQGISLYHANKKPAARERLQELVKRYPNSPEATRAKQFLAENK